MGDIFGDDQGPVEKDLLAFARRDSVPHPILCEVRLVPIESFQA
jgi:hypothetical protein